jgi:hypothetical protein
LPGANGFGAAVFACRSVPIAYNAPRLPGGSMKLSRVNIAGLTSLNPGWQRRFSFHGTTDHKKKPLIEGLFFARFSANRHA